MKGRSKPAYAGVGLLLDPNHIAQIVAERPAVPWFEILTEQVIGFRNNKFQLRITDELEFVWTHYPVSLHGIELNIGSTDPLDFNYLKQLKSLKKHVKPILISDHLCFTGSNRHVVHELLPLPFTKSTLLFVSEKIRMVQDILDCRLVLENPPSYIQYRSSEMSETDFLNELCHSSGCRLLLDLNNIYVSSKNNDFDASNFVREIESDFVHQYHLAGFEKEGSFLLDTHSRSVSNRVWALFKLACKKFGPINASLEWDLNTPALEVLLHETDKATKIQFDAQAPSPSPA